MEGDILGASPLGIQEEEPILQHFNQNALDAVSKMFADLAHELVRQRPRNPERTVALRKLLEGSDAATRARRHT